MFVYTFSVGLLPVFSPSRFTFSLHLVIQSINVNYDALGMQNFSDKRVLMYLRLFKYKI